MSGLRFLTLAALVCAASACATRPPAPTGIFDPNEERNRAVHAFNKDLDRNFIRPVARTYVTVVPVEGQDMVANFSDNASLPGVVVNNILQGDLTGAGRNTLRFVYNSTLGFGGLFDVSREFGLEQDDTDFGETLHVWGMPEGAYVESPVFGPSTRRDSVGGVVDFVLDPVGWVVPRPQRYYKTGAKVLKRLGSRGRYSDTVDSVYYESADSYAQSRLIYLQNRRFELGQTASAGSEEEVDPFALDTEGF